MLVLVTGAPGFLGAHVVHALLRQGDEVRALVRPGGPRNHIRKLGVGWVEGDLLDADGLESACVGADAVVHTAALLSYWSRHRRELERVNVEGTMNLLRAAHAAGVKRVVHVSSAATVGTSPQGEILDEQAFWEPKNERIAYVRTKRRAEERVLAASWGGLPAVVVNPSTLLGPRLDGRPPSPLITGIMHGQLPWVPPGGVSVTDVSDVALAVVRALRTGRPGERYLLTGHNLTWEQLYATIAEHADGRVPTLKLGPGRLKWLRGLAAIKDPLRLTRPPWTPDLYRGYGTYAWYDAGKATAELGYRIRPLCSIIRHTTRRDLE